MSSKADKQYGLILSKKQQPVAPKLGNVFGDDNGSDEDDGADWVKKALKAEGEKNKMKKQTKLSMQKALKEDPTIYQYDEVYDDMERTKVLQKGVKQEEKRPKYIENLLKAAERRKKEQEHRIERMVQKEREAEGTMYADKESFVTSTYRAKLEEFKQMEEEEARMSRLEAIGDVTKQQDMSGFYRHLFAQTMEDPKQTEPHSVAQGTKLDNKDNAVSSSVDDSPDKDASSNKEETSNKEQTKFKKVRQYRQRVVEADDTDNETEEKSDAKPNVEIKDTPIKNKSVDDKATIEEPECKKQKKDVEEKPVDEVSSTITRETDTNTKTQKNTEEHNDTNAKPDKPDIIAIEKIALEKKEKSRIWEKRTVGDAFQAALQRYYARKALRLVEV